MKYLKLFEDIKTIDSNDMKSWGSTEEPTSKDPPIDKKYFDQVFAEFLDNGSTSEIEYDGDKIIKYILITDYDSDSSNNNSNYFQPNFYFTNIDEFAKYTNNLNEFSLELKSCLGKIKDDYPNILDNFHDNVSDYMFEFTLYYPRGYFG